MTDQASKAGGGLKGALSNNPATDRLKQEAAAFAAAQAERLLAGVGRKLGTATGKLNDVAAGNSPALSSVALSGGKKLLEGKGVFRSAVEMGAEGVKDKAKGLFKGLTGKKKGGGGGGKKVINIIEDINVGVPVREAYNQWTQYQEFGNFTKGVQSVDQKDDTTTNWRAKVLWSSRSWAAKVTEQVPDKRIAWTSEGAKGTTKGVVTFHELADNLTQVLLVIEYYPKGLFEKTGNIWRAQGRRARLDLKHYRRFVMMRGEATGGWRGEIEEGEVVRDHDEVVAAEEEQENQQAESAEGAEGAEGAEQDGAESEHEEDEHGEPADEAEYEDEELPEDEAAAEDEYEEGEYADEEEPQDEAPAEDEAAAEDEYEYEDELEAEEGTEDAPEEEYEAEREPEHAHR